MNFDLDYIVEKSGFINKFKNDEIFRYEEVNALPSIQILTLLKLYKDLKPLAITRFLILQMLLNKEVISSATIEQIKEDIHSRTLDNYKRYLKPEQLNALLTYKTKKPLATWGDFGILYDFFYISEAKLKIAETFNDVAVDLIQRFNLNKHDYKIINLQGARNQGDKECWVSIYPKRFEKYNDSAQIYCKADAGALYAGLYIHQDMKAKYNIKPFDYERVPCSSYSDVVACISKVLKLAKDLNARFMPPAQEDEEEELKQVQEFTKVNAEKQTFENYSKDEFLRDVFLGEKEYKKLTALLECKKNLILQGPPGVGKTYSAKRLAYSIIGKKDENRVNIVQFHENYGYEDFIMGYKVTKDHFELQKGAFCEFCEKAQKDPNEKYFFIMDEINRGRICKIFGELLSLIEVDRRGETVKLMYDNADFYIPKNLYIIGLMNTSDRSIAMIDYALRRRFAFYDFKPAFSSKGFQEYKKVKNNQKFDNLIDKIIELNQEISQDSSLGDGFLIGHSYFCTKNEISDQWISNVVNFEILPLLREYWFDDKNLYLKWQNELKDNFNYETV